MCLCAGELQVVPVAVKAEAVENVCVSWCCYYEGKLQVVLSASTGWRVD